MQNSVKPATEEQLANYIRTNWPGPEKISDARKVSAHEEGKDPLVAHFGAVIRNEASWIPQGDNVWVLQLCGVGFKMLRWSVSKQGLGVIWLPVLHVPPCQFNGWSQDIVIASPGTFLSAEAARESVVTIARRMLGADLPFGAITLNSPLPEETRAKPASKPAAKKPAKTAGFRPSTVH